VRPLTTAKLARSALPAFLLPFPLGWGVGVAPGVRGMSGAAASSESKEDASGSLVVVVRVTFLLLMRLSLRTGLLAGRDGRFSCMQFLHASVSHTLATGGNAQLVLYLYHQKSIFLKKPHQRSLVATLNNFFVTYLAFLQHSMQAQVGSRLLVSYWYSYVFRKSTLSPAFFSLSLPNPVLPFEHGE
jgi:hypothetical protein